MAAPNLPPPGYYSDFTSPIPHGEGPVGAAGYWDNIVARVKSLIGGDAEQAATLASDTFAPAEGTYAISAEGSPVTTTDNLALIGITNAWDGMQVELHPVAGQTITAKNNAGGVGNILMADGADYVMNAPSMRLWVQLNLAASTWTETDRSYGNNKAGFIAWLALTIGTNVQAYSAALTTLAGAITTAGQAMAAAANAAAQRTLLGLGSAALLNVGTGANNIPQLDGSGRMPGVDGSQLTNLPGSITHVAPTSFTPQIKINGSATGITGSQSGTYERIGNVVFFTISIGLSSKGSGTGQVTISGFPVANAGGPNVQMNDMVNMSGLTGAIGAVWASSTTLQIELQTSTGVNELTNSNLSNTSSFQLTGFYPV